MYSSCRFGYQLKVQIAAILNLIGSLANVLNSNKTVLHDVLAFDSYIGVTSSLCEIISANFIISFSKII